MTGRGAQRHAGFGRWFAATVTVLAALLAAPASWAQQAAHVVGAEACGSCHAAQHAAWQGSHHAQAMQPATPRTVLGDFADAQFAHKGTVTTFRRDGDRFLVRTRTPDGAEREDTVAYTFGVAPLQQYLIAFPDGRFQALQIAWDTRPVTQGGQRWFHLQPTDTPLLGDRLHWTGRDQTWNHQCADCHSTGVQRNYDLAGDSYRTSFDAVDVSCEACHGMGSRHVAWAQARPAGAARPATDDRMGFFNWLRPTDPGTWEMNPATGIARRTAPLVSAELDTCAPCHARRKALRAAPPAGTPFLNAYQPMLLRDGEYFPDGQIQGEVFEWGSFVQSAMHGAGVTCSNCHDPHTLALRAPGNAVCAQCHLPERFDAASHHHHDPAGTGGTCVACHMPTRTYMIVHDRHDHSLRVPRPDLSLTLGTPNACTQCHRDRDAVWAARAVAGWYPGGRQTRPHFGTALAAGRAGAPDAPRLLAELVADAAAPPIARATALTLLGRNSGAAPTTLARAAGDIDPLVRAAAPDALPAEPPPASVQIVARLLNDPVLAVRVAAARALAGHRQGLDLSEPQRRALARGLRDLHASEMVDSDRPESHLNIGLTHARAGMPGAAAESYRTALRLDPRFVPALVNLADLDRMAGRSAEASATLRQAIAIDAGNADAWHALGLALVRQRETAEAMAALRRAHELAPDNPRFAYVYAVGLNGTGAPAQAIAVLEDALRRHPGDRDLLVGAISFARDMGDTATALRHARTLAQAYPDDSQVRALVRQLEQAGGR